MASIHALLNISSKTHASDVISLNALKNVRDESILHGLHKPYCNDYKNNRIILANKKKAKREAMLCMN